MRKQFVTTVSEIMDKDPKVILLLGDIGVFGFSELMKKYPTRVYNIGILEQSTISMAAGLAIAGFTPIVHSIAPFIIERCIEQIKDDFGYQGLGINIVSVGASYDYASLGCTHHCPADVALLSNIPGTHIFIPGRKEEFDIQFKENHSNGKINYYRLSEKKHTCDSAFYQAGSKGTVVAVGNVLDIVHDALVGVDIEIIYQNKFEPTISGAFYVEPYYSERPGINIPKKFLVNYGTPEDHDKALGFTVENIRQKVAEYFKLRIL